MYRVSTIYRSICSRAFSTNRGNVLEHLTNRKLIRVSGNEVSDFLQGLITNDMRHLEHGIGSMYAMFLNTKGRVLYDTLVYKPAEENTFLLECDEDAFGPLLKHLKMFRVRRKIDVIGAENLHVFALFDPGRVDVGGAEKSLDGVIVPCDALKGTENTGTMEVGGLMIYRDPRVAALGSRIIAPSDCDVATEVGKIVGLREGFERNYRWFRYSLGVGEGTVDLPPNNCFPLEANCDYLHGVSFHKGCYLGQELTARTHHTGVVRKRLLPLIFNKNFEGDIEKNSTIIHETVNLGKLRDVEGNVGLALLRIAKAIEFKTIKIGSNEAATGKPNWWPLEAPKAKMTA